MSREADAGDVIQRIEMKPRRAVPCTSREEYNSNQAEDAINKRHGLDQGRKGVLHRFGSVEPAKCSEIPEEEQNNPKGNHYFPTNTKFGHYRSLTNSEHSKERQVLQKIEDFIFFTKTGNLSIFRCLDQDGDSYISMKELVEKFRMDHLLTRDEEKTLVGYLDPNKKGYVEFAEFHSKVYPNVANSEAVQSKTRENGETKDQQRTATKLLRAAGPSKEYHEMTRMSLPSIQETREKFAKPFRTRDGLFRKTRYNGNPQFHDTIREFIPDRNSAFYSSEKERFDQCPGHRLAFQKEDKEKRSRSQEAKTAKIQLSQSQNQEFRQNSRERRSRKEAYTLANKANAGFLYEHVKLFLFFPA